MSDSQSSSALALVPIEQREVEFYEDLIVAVLVHVEGQEEPAIYVPVRAICDYLGVDWSAQRRRINRDAVLSQVVEFVAVTATKSRGNPNKLALPIEYLNGWLFGINANRVRDEIREKLIRYQKECYRTLWNAFRSDVLGALGATPTLTPVEQVREFGLALARLAEEHIELEGRVSAAEKLGDDNRQRLDQAAQVVGGLMREVAEVKRRIAPGAPVTEEQAAEIQQQVKALAMLLYEHDSSKSHFQGVWGELYRRFGVTGYKNIGVDQYPDVLAFLDEWRRRVAEDAQ